MLAYRDGRRARLISRNAVDHTARFRELAAAIAKPKPDVVVLDGEVAVDDEKLVSRFHLLGDPDTGIVCTPPVFIAFDVLQRGNRDLRRRPLADRRAVLEAGTLRLDPGATKNDDGRVVYLTTEVKALLAGQLERVEALQKRTGRIVPFLFPYLTGKSRQGERRRDFRKAWTAATKAAGSPGGSATTSGGRRCETSSTRASRSARRCRYHIVSPADLPGRRAEARGHNPRHSECRCGRLASCKLLKERRMGG